MKQLRWLLLPLSIPYGLVVLVRNWLYDAGFFKSSRFNLPVISVGNLAVGGAGKSPMTEYLVRLLKPHNRVATLSRGYGRKTKGFYIADVTPDAVQLGDEPAQFKHKFPDVTVAVCEDRAAGIRQLMVGHDVVIMDDAYQHRAVTPGLSILLFDYNSLLQPQMLLPAGNLREFWWGRWRADILVVSKCPETLSPAQQLQIAQKVKPYNFQQLFFTAIAYLPLQALYGEAVYKSITANATIFLLTGIANATPMLNYIKKQTANVVHHKYADHHQFSLKNISKLATEFNACTASQKFIITTEKDAQRLNIDELHNVVKQLPFYILPIGVKFLQAETDFTQIINNYVREHIPHNTVH